MHSSVLFLLSLAVPIGALGSCYTPGPAFPPVNRILNKTHYEEIATKLSAVANNVLQNPQKWTTNTTSFAVLVTTPEDTIWDFYHTAPILGDYHDSEPTPVTGDTAFRVASCSKTFTVYAVLLEKGINLEDPITKFIPELLEQDDVPDLERRLLVQWDQITIRSLASQLSGIAREGGLGDLAVDSEFNPDPLKNGFPPVDEGALAPCMKNSTDRACTSQEIVKMARRKRRVFNPNDRSTYSNVAFSLLGLALERVTGESYDKVLYASILGPLGMKNTRTTKPKDSDGIIPFGPNDWAQKLGSDNPSGGVYTTANDFGKYLRSILTSKLLPQTVINAWMKPHSWTSSGTNSAYGMPWEIMRSTKLTPDGRAVDIITKGGALNQYFSTIILIPEFGLGVTILIAGHSSALWDLRENIIATLVPAADKLVRQEVRAVYAGTWADSDSFWGPPNWNWSLKLEVDNLGPGMRVREWVSNGTDFLEVYGRMKVMPSDPDAWEARLIPTGVYIEPTDNERDGQGDIWRHDIWRLTDIPKRDPKGSDKVFDDYCMTDVDALMYNGLSVEEFVFAGVKRESPGSGKGMKEADFLFISGMRTNMMKWKNADGKLMNVEAAHRQMEDVGGTQIPLIFRGR